MTTREQPIAFNSLHMAAKLAGTTPRDLLRGMRALDMLAAMMIDSALYLTSEQVDELKEWIEIQNEIKSKRKKKAAASSAA